MRFCVLSARGTGKSPSVWFQTEETKVLYGLGGNEVVFEQAKKSGIDLSEVDALILPNGLAETSGSLKRFLRLNGRAAVFGKPAVFDEYFEKGLFGMSPCGIGKYAKICASRFVPISENFFALDASVSLFSAPAETGRRFYKFAAAHRNGEDFTVELPDDFSHELSAAVVTDSGAVVLTANPHAGIEGLFNALSERMIGPTAAVLGSLDYGASDIPRSTILRVDCKKPKKLSAWQERFSDCERLRPGDVFEF